MRPRVEAVARDTILPPDVFQRFENDTFWRNPELNRNGIRIV